MFIYLFALSLNGELFKRDSVFVLVLPKQPQLTLPHVSNSINLSAYSIRVEVSVKFLLHFFLVMVSKNKQPIESKI